MVVKIPRNKLDGGEENGVGQKRRRLMKGDDDWNGRISSLGSPEGANHEDEDAFGMTNSDDDEDETTASRDGNGPPSSAPKGAGRMALAHRHS